MVTASPPPNATAYRPCPAGRCRRSAPPRPAWRRARRGVARGSGYYTFRFRTPAGFRRAVHAHRRQHGRARIGRLRPHASAEHREVGCEPGVVVIGEAEYLQQLARAFEVGILRTVGPPRRAVVAIFRAARRLRQRVGIAPVDDRAGELLRPRALDADGEHQAGQQRRVGMVEVDLAVLVDDAHLDVGAGEIPPVRTSVRPPLPARVRQRDAGHRVFEPRARRLVGLHAVHQRMPLQAFGARGQRERTDERDQQHHQPQHEQQCGTARMLHRAAPVAYAAARRGATVSGGHGRPSAPVICTSTSNGNCSTAVQLSFHSPGAPFSPRPR